MWPSCMASPVHVCRYPARSGTKQTKARNRKHYLPQPPSPPYIKAFTPDFAFKTRYCLRLLQFPNRQSSQQLNPSTDSPYRPTKQAPRRKTPRTCLSAHKSPVSTGTSAQSATRSSPSPPSTCPTSTNPRSSTRASRAPHSSRRATPSCYTNPVAYSPRGYSSPRRCCAKQRR